MIQCANCGQTNTRESNFCRFCGTRFTQSQMSSEGSNNNYEYSPPRPYSWKTDEYQIKEKNAPKVQQINRVSPLPDNDPYRTNQTARPQPLVHQYPHQMTHGYQCPRCGTQALPTLSRRVSTAGWITFAVLLVTTGIFFWIGLLIKEDVRVCPVCSLQLTQ